MVQHEIRSQCIFFRQPVDVFPRSERRIHNIIIDHREAPVSRRREEREDVHACDFLFKVSIQHMLERFQVTAHAVRVGDEHALVFDFSHIPSPS